MDQDFIIFPAIDLKGGKCVRLKQGRADDETVYGDNPVEQAKAWVEQGARFLHVVDLDGAFEGHPVHTDVVLQIAQAIDIPIEIGGGLRTSEHIRTYLAGGVNRIILGTKACENADELKPLVDEFGEGIVIGIDAKNGWVQVKGWTETTSLSAIDLARQMEAIGVRTIIYTDTARDGMMQGVNLEAFAELCDAVSCSVVASGGVTCEDDIKNLKALNRKNLVGAIVGKALYEGAVSIDSLQQEA